MSARVRRATVRKVDYAKANEFSDEEIFEDSPDEDPQPSSRRRGRPRKTDTGIRTAVPDTDNDEVYPPKPIYTEIGYDRTLPPIRDRFPFLPEYEEDGSPKIELIVGRRPIDDKEGDDGEIEGKESVDEELDEVKTRPRRGSPIKKTKGSPGTKSDNSGRVEYEYLVKYKGRSYLHLEWKTGADLESMNKSAKGIYRRYLKKIAAGTEEDIENPEFDPSYAIPEKIVDEREQEITIELTDEELLKLEKERERELAEESDSDDEGEAVVENSLSESNPARVEEEKKGKARFE
jgi:hypothetical protein